ncbi:ROK family protein [Georgenia sp.]
MRRGAQGGAGDPGHIAVPHSLEVTCRCADAGCLAAVASSRAAGVSMPVVC